MRIRNPAHNKGGSYTLAGRRGGGGQYFGRRETGLPSCNNNLSTIRITVCMFTILQVNDTVRSCSLMMRTKRWMLNHIGRKPISCTHCQMSFARRSNLEVHSRIYTGETYPPESSFKNSYRRKTVQLYQLYKVFSTTLPRESSFKNSYRRERIKLFIVWEALYKFIGTDDCFTLRTYF